MTDAMSCRNMSLKFGCVILFIKVITHLLLSRPFDSIVFCKQNKKTKFEGIAFTESVKVVANTYNDILMTSSPLQKKTTQTGKNGSAF